ncbi:MAG: tripartite tricarboxylate transporter permease, partial [Pseudomonadota bacterium]
MTSFGAAAVEGLSAVFSFPGILIPIAGTLIAMTTSFLPGIGSSSLIGIVLVATLTWDPVSVMLLFGALTGGATFMGSITAILFNIPGSTPSSAALLDGYPLGERGYPQTAIACAATASALGSLFGVVVLLTILPYIRPFLLAFGAFEMLLLGIWGLTTLVAVPNVSPIKGLAMCLLGFLVGMIGSDPISGDPRWTFGSFVLFQGLPLVSLMLGIFTFSELIGWARRYDLQTPTLSKRAADDSTWRGIVAVFRHWALSLRSAIIGTVVGIVPGVGGTVAGFVAYGQAVSTTKDPDATFGKGDIRGLIAPESAIDSKDGGSLLPVISFGIPGSESGVILLLVFSIHGIVPGVNLLTEQLHLSYILIFALLFSNVLTSIIGVGLAPYLARLKDLRIDLIVLPALLISAVAIVQ